MFAPAFSAAQHTIESAEFNFEYTQTPPTSTHLDPSFSPSAQADTTFYTHSYEYKMQPALPAPMPGYLNPSGAPLGQAANNFYTASHEFKMEPVISAPASAHLNPASAPSAQADTTFYTHSYEYKILPVIQAPQSTHLDPSQATEQSASKTFYVQSQEYKIQPSLSSPKNIKKFYITNSSGQPVENVQADASNENTSEIETRSITNSSGGMLVSFNNSTDEYRLDFFNILKSTYSMDLVPEGYTGAPLDPTPINITINNLSGNMWANEKWKYQIPINITIESDAKDLWVKKEINFMEYLETLGKTTTFDENSVRIVEVDAQGRVINENVSEVTPK